MTNKEIINISNLSSLDRLLKSVIKKVDRLEREGNESKAAKKRRLGMRLINRMKFIEYHTKRKKK